MLIVDVDEKADNIFDAFASGDVEILDDEEDESGNAIALLSFDELASRVVGALFELLLLIMLLVDGDDDDDDE